MTHEIVGKYRYLKPEVEKVSEPENLVPRNF